MVKILLVVSYWYYCLFGKLTIGGLVKALLVVWPVWLICLWFRISTIGGLVKILLVVWHWYDRWFGIGSIGGFGNLHWSN